MENTPDSPPLGPEETRHLLERNGLAIPDERWEMLLRWAEVMQEVNQRVNLISRKEAHLLWERHALPCLALLALRTIPEGVDVCDFGTGGGLPGLLLALARPDLRVTLLDSRQKKLSVVQEMIDALGASNAQVALGRGEELGKVRPWRQRCPVLTARAVAPLEDLVRWTRDLRKPAGVLHVFKGGEIREEIIRTVKQFPGTKIEKSLMVLKGYTGLAENQKFLVTLNFSTTVKS
jgi:16S rRNA (guanine527-N7)-methyltransferase